GEIMKSNEKARQSRINGAKSTGPKTAESRQKSASNSLRHGLTARHLILLPCEDPAEFAQLCADYGRIYTPTNAAEQDLVDEIIPARGRIRRIWMTESALLQADMEQRVPEFDAQFPDGDGYPQLAFTFKALADGSRCLPLLSRYESRLHRA